MKHCAWYTQTGYGSSQDGSVRREMQHKPVLWVWMLHMDGVSKWNGTISGWPFQTQQIHWAKHKCWSSHDGKDFNRGLSGPTEVNILSTYPRGMGQWHVYRWAWIVCGANQLEARLSEGIAQYNPYEDESQDDDIFPIFDEEPQVIPVWGTNI